MPRSRRRRGAPNLYAMRPFRNSRKVRERAGKARQKRVHYLVLGVLGAVALMALAGFYLHSPKSAPLEGAAAVAADNTGGLVLLAGGQLLRHDRAGNAGESLDLATLGVNALVPPLAFAPDGTLFAQGVLAGTNSARPHMLRCDLAQRSCNRFSPSADDIAADTFALHPLGDGIFAADASAGQLLKVTAAEGVAARAALPLPNTPALTPHNGLLLVNSAQGPAIGVFRYDANAFGEQLDEVLLLPPGEDIAQLRVGDFLWNAGAWWVTLYDPGGHAAIHRFDRHWNHLARVPLAGARMPLELVSWGAKTLVNDHRGSSLARFNANGEMEVPLRSASLDRLLADSRRAHHLRELGRFALLLAAGLFAVAGLTGAWLQHLRALVYRGARPQGAEPVDDRMDAVHWIEAAPRRRAMLRRRGTGVCFAGLRLLPGRGGNGRIGLAARGTADGPGGPRFCTVAVLPQLPRQHRRTG
ncbi:MAG: hypothetical protein U5K56_19885 [Halioglobus sp.]|nr:hypothetical protein [Halioglobus sp.]